MIVRPGDKIPVDGRVLSGQATIDQSAITGERMPVEAGIGAPVYAASIAELGSLRVQTVHAGADTTFGRVIRMVEEAEAHRANVSNSRGQILQLLSAVVAGIAFLTLVLRRDPLAAAAVLVVACSCSFALATPIAMLASVGAAAKRGVLIKGGKYLETLARADVLLVDKDRHAHPWQAPAQRGCLAQRIISSRALDARRKRRALLRASARRGGARPRPRTWSRLVGTAAIREHPRFGGARRRERHAGRGGSLG